MVVYTLYKGPKQNMKGIFFYESTFVELKIFDGYLLVLTLCTINEGMNNYFIHINKQQQGVYIHSCIF
jgi:hypothetical protein